MLAKLDSTWLLCVVPAWMIGLFMSASVKVPLGLLELQAFHKWDISLCLEQHTPQQVMSLSYKRGTLSHLLELQSFSNKIPYRDRQLPWTPLLGYREQCAATGAQGACG